MIRLLTVILLMLLCACSAPEHKGTIAELQRRSVDLSEVEISGGLDQAMAGYQQFLLDSQPGSALTPEALRRLADLKIEKEYGVVADSGAEEESETVLPAPQTSTEKPVVVAPTEVPIDTDGSGESELEFEQRTTRKGTVAEAETDADLATDLALDDLEKAGPLEAIALYRKLLDEYPLYPRNDQVLYQMSRAYEELGRIEEAMEVMNRLVREYPESRYIDEVQFRRAENLFSYRKYLDAEDAYASIVAIGVASEFYQLALYKLGWTYYKQELYEDALHRFIGLLDTKVDIGYDFEQQDDPLERKRIEDTFRVISLSFSYLGGAEATADYFGVNGGRDFEDIVYENLADYYFAKRRYSDAVATYDKFVALNRFHRKAPLFALKIIDINTAGGFPSLVIEAKKSFARDYGVSSEYWDYFEQEDRPEVIAGIKANLTDLANHYHALYQNPKLKKEQDANFAEAVVWYREYLTSFPDEIETARINYQLADLLLENRSFRAAAVEYEKTAYNFEAHEQAARAGYAAVYSWRQHLSTVTEEGEAQTEVKRQVIRSSLLFAETYPEHDKAAVVLGAAADDLYALADYEQALYAAHDLVEFFPAAKRDVARSAWLVIGHSSYELELFAPAEAAYLEVLALLDEGAENRAQLVDNLATAIYRQGEEANRIEDYAAAAEHFLRIVSLAPTSAIRSTAEYDAATAFIQLKNWNRSIEVLIGFRNNFPEHELQPEITKKLAYVYREDGQAALAAAEFERIERESDDPAIRSESLLLAAELYQEAELIDSTLAVYLRYIGYFPEPLAIYIETCQKIADIYKAQQRQEDYLAMLKQIVAIDAGAGEQRTERTMFLAAKAALVPAELNYQTFADIALTMPFAKNLKRKQTAMKALIAEFSGLIEYQVGEVTAAATYYLAEIYADFSIALMESERPQDLDPIELEEYELALEDQAYPFEEKAISVHQSNLELIDLGVYNAWVEKSLARLAEFVPARYAKSEEEAPLVRELGYLAYELVIEPEPVPEAALEPAAGQSAETAQMDATPQEKTAATEVDDGAGTPVEVKE